jgi:hypothetical protein
MRALAGLIAAIAFTGLVLAHAPAADAAGVLGGPSSILLEECEGDSCQVLPPPPEEPALGTAFFTPEVNPPRHNAKPGGNGGKSHRRRHKHSHHQKKKPSSRVDRGE